MTAEAMLDINDLSGEESLLKLIQPDTRESKKILCQAVAILMEQAELARRHMGYDKGSFLSAEAIGAMASPVDIPMLKIAVADVILQGYGKSTKTPEREVDLVLQELQKKTE
jgi:hypothetical protein